VLTDLDMYLLNKDYKGGGSNMRTSATKAVSSKNRVAGKMGGMAGTTIAAGPSLHKGTTAACNCR